jgi:O-antigen/teichoic acid export membrane protein
MVVILLLLNEVNFILVLLIESSILIAFLFLIIYFTKTKMPWVSKSNNPDKSALKMTSSVFIHSIATVIVFNTDSITLAIFKSLEATSIYGVYNYVVKFVINVLHQLLSAPSNAFGNIFASGDMDKLKNQMKNYEFIVVVTSTITLATLYCIITKFINLYINRPEYNVDILGLFMCISAFLNFIRRPALILVEISGEFKKTRKYAMVEAIINLLLSIILLKLFGISGVVLATIISFSICNFFVIKYVYRNILLESELVYYKVLLENSVLIILMV